MKSAKKLPLESDEHGPLKHAPRPEFKTLDAWDIRQMADYWWRDIGIYTARCRDCGHRLASHCRGWCQGCRHECAAVDALHDELRQVFERYGAPRAQGATR